jgi:hypothetical protein
VSVRHILLGAAAIAVLGMGVYLFLEVRSGSAQGVATAPPVAPARVAGSAAPPPAAETAPETSARSAKVAPNVPMKRSDPAPSLESHEEPTTASADEGKANPKLDSIMDQANKAYDRQDFDEAKAIAGKVLSKMPTNVRMLRIMVSSSCIDGDVAVAQKYFPALPKFDRDQLKARCDRYGVTLTDPPQ